MSGPPPRTTARRASTGVVLVVLTALALAGQAYGLYRPDPPPQPDWLPHADNVAHLLGFAVPVALALLTIRWWTPTAPRVATTLVVIAFVLQALVSELVQSVSYPGRTGDVGDLIADGVGIALGVLIFTLVRR